MDITSGLIIAQPWINKIINGEKDWEMRTKHCKKRGYIGLIEKGTGMVVAIAKLTKSTGPYSRQDMLNNPHRHGIPKEMINSGEVDQWQYAWNLEYIKKLTPAVSYQHKSGAVTWVTLDRQAQEAIYSQASKAIAIEASATYPFRTVQIQEANLKYNHIYLSRIIDFFPEDCIGGPNQASAASRLLSVSYDKSDTIATDIDGKHKFFRARGKSIRNFFTENKIKAGDQVNIEKISAYRYRLTKT